MVTRIIIVLRSIYSDAEMPVYLMPNLLTLGSLANAKRFRTRKAAEQFLKDNNELLNLRVAEELWP